MKNCRRISIILCTCLLLSSLSACTEVSRQETIEKVHNDIAAPEQSEAMPIEEQPQEASTSAKEKTVLKIAGIGSSQSKIKMVINEFNKTDSDYMVSLTDYAYGVPAEQGKMALQTALMGSGRPDMLLFDDEVYLTSDDPTQGLSPLSYISSGMLLDLDEFVEADPALSADDFIVWDALHEFGGMYVVGSKFYVDVLCCLPETAEKYQGWTLDDYITLQDSLNRDQKMMYYITPEWFIQSVGSHYLHEVIDIQNATCDFESPNFIAILKAAQQIQTSIAEGDHMQLDGSFKSAQEMLMDGDIIFAHRQLCSAYDTSFDRYCSGGIRLWYGEGESPYQDRTGGTEPMGYTGYPTPDGSNGMYIKLPYSVGICAGTEKVKGCWEFIRFMLEHPMYQDQNDGTPVLEAMLEDNLQSIAHYADLSRWETEKKDQGVLVEAAKRCQLMSYFDYDILGIVEEEAAEVLAGKKTAEDAAKMTQNRASVLVMEQYG